MAARILIIEDNQANMDLIVYLLEAFGHQPVPAYDGEQGVLLAQSALPDLIICDLHLPKLDGYGVLRQLKEHALTRAIPVLAASALPVNDGGAALRAAGFDGHLPKSLEPDTLISSLEAFLRPELHSAGRPAQHQEADASPAAPLVAKARILLLDAAPAGGGLVASIVAHFDYAVTVVADAAQAADCAGQQFDLVLCDLEPLDGRRIAFAQEALAHWPALPVLLLRPDDDDDVAQLFSRRAHRPCLLSHPIEPLELVEAIASCLAGAAIIHA